MKGILSDFVCLLFGPHDDENYVHSWGAIAGVMGGIVVLLVLAMVFRQ